MKLGLTAAGMGKTVSIDIEMIRHAESLGYDSVWTAEAWGADAITPLAWIAAQTTKIKLGTGIMQIPARTPAMLGAPKPCKKLNRCAGQFWPTMTPPHCRKT